jgi:hypothetical protein
MQLLCLIKVTLQHFPNPEDESTESHRFCCTTILSYVCPVRWPCPAEIRKLSSPTETSNFPESADCGKPSCGPQSVACSQVIELVRFRQVSLHSWWWTNNSMHLTSCRCPCPCQVSMSLLLATAVCMSLSKYVSMFMSMSKCPCPCPCVHVRVPIRVHSHVQHGLGHAAWTWTWSTDIEMQHGHCQAALIQTWPCQSTAKVTQNHVKWFTVEKTAVKSLWSDKVNELSRWKWFYSFCLMVSL